MSQIFFDTNQIPYQEEKFENFIDYERVLLGKRIDLLFPVAISSRRVEQTRD
jgi:hypothetical protein